MKPACPKDYRYCQCRQCKNTATRRQSNRLARRLGKQDVRKALTER